MPIWSAMPTPRLYCPAKLFPNLFYFTSERHFRSTFDGEGTTYQLMTPGNAAYEPVTQKNVPRYLTPGETPEMLIEKPRRSMQRPARMKGERRWILSDHIAKTYNTVAGAS